LIGILWIPAAWPLSSGRVSTPSLGFGEGNCQIMAWEMKRKQFIEGDGGCSICFLLAGFSNKKMMVEYAIIYCFSSISDESLSPSEYSP
jgi:hypothetical protein